MHMLVVGKVSCQVASLEMEDGLDLNSGIVMA